MSLAIPTKKKRKSATARPATNHEQLYVIRFANEHIIVLDEYYDHPDKTVYLRVDPTFAEHKSAAKLFVAIAARVNDRNNPVLRLLLCGKQNPQPILCSDDMRRKYATVRIVKKDHVECLLAGTYIQPFYRLHFLQAGQHEVSRWKELLRPVQYFGPIAEVQYVARSQFVMPT